MNLRSLLQLLQASNNVGVLLKSDNTTGFGMNIQGNMNEGIYVKTIVPMGAADQTGNILPGDRIKSLTINFDNMVYEDALTLLSYASPYKVKFELERKVETPPPMDGDPTNARIHPLFRSNTLTHIQFNAVGSSKSSAESKTRAPEPLPRIEEAVVKEAAAEEAERPPLPTPEPPAKPQEVKVKDEEEKPAEAPPPPPSSPPTEPISSEVVTSAVISEVADSTTIDTDLSKMESSDYASDNTSEYRSDPECGNGNQPSPTAAPAPIIQDPVSERVEKADIAVETVLPSKKPTSPVIEYCKALPPKAKTSTLSRSPSPKVSKPMSKSPSPVPSVKAGLRTSREDCSKPPTQMAAPIKRQMSNGRSASATAPTRLTEASNGPPEIVEARVSRIPKRTDSIKTPIIERKLPPLPKSLNQRSHSAEDKGDVWSRLYTDKRNMLRKTRDVEPVTRTTAETDVTSTIPSPQLSPRQIPPPTDYRFSTLDSEHRERLAANQEILDRQTEELRKLGIL
ncbi:unnamed protein product [Heligmosomoides polygyrus]|uniref:PDZ domain-containing protein n=1 Tax=Heligmosomoides polygyrus TaxID=6339 RepID=A0A183FVA6_HELPZ|nr:unnamed protein product [Heligmosomoides polygyrus]